MCVFCRKVENNQTIYSSFASNLLARDLLEGTQAMREVRKSHQVRVPSASMHLNPIAAKTLNFKYTPEQNGASWRISRESKGRHRAVARSSWL